MTAALFNGLNHARLGRTCRPTRGDTRLCCTWSSVQPHQVGYFLARQGNRRTAGVQAVPARGSVAPPGAQLRWLLKCLLQVRAIQRSGFPGVCLPFLLEKSANLALFYRVDREVVATASRHAKCLKAAYLTSNLCARHLGLWLLRP